jgi:hypothetical protein
MLACISDSGPLVPFRFNFSTIALSFPALGSPGGNVPATHLANSKLSHMSVQELSSGR